MSNCFSPMPKKGDILWCKFPMKIGVKMRPALVLHVEGVVVVVAYGTSQKTNILYPTEFLIKEQDPGFDLSGLSYSTKFDLENWVELEFNSDWFGESPNDKKNIPEPKMGVVHPSYVPEIEKAWCAVKKKNKAKED